MPFVNLTAFQEVGQNEKTQILGMGNGILPVDDYVYRQKESITGISNNNKGGINNNGYLEMESRRIVCRRNVVRY